MTSLSLSPSRIPEVPPQPRAAPRRPPNPGRGPPIPVLGSRYPPRSGPQEPQSALPTPGGPAPEQLGRVGWPALLQQHEHGSRTFRAGLYAVPSWLGRMRHDARPRASPARPVGPRPGPPNKIRVPLPPLATASSAKPWSQLCAGGRRRGDGMGRESSPALNGPTPPRQPNPGRPASSPSSSSPSSQSWGNSTGSDRTEEGRLTRPLPLSKATNHQEVARGPALSYASDAEEKPGSTGPHSEKGALGHALRDRGKSARDNFIKPRPSSPKNPPQDLFLKPLLESSAPAHRWPVGV